MNDSKIFPKVLLVFLALVSCLSSTHVSAKEPLRVLDGVVERVTDGDTVVIFAGTTKLKVRLYGIDAPETEKNFGGVHKPGQPFGEEAFLALKEKIDGRKVIVEVLDIDQRYGREVAIIRYNGRDINQEMIDEGWAWAYRQYLDRPHASGYIGSEEGARRARRGLWQQNNPMPPWEFRKLISKGGL